MLLVAGNGKIPYLQPDWATVAFSGERYSMPSSLGVMDRAK